MKIGVLFIHGFTGGPFEVAPLRQFLKTRTDWILAAPVLPGHDPEQDLEKSSAASWLMAAELELQRLMRDADRVFLIGFSMGGLIAMYLALRYPVEKLVLLSAAAKYISPRILVEDARIMLRSSISHHYPENSFYHLYNYKLTHTPIRSALEFLRIVRLVKPYHRDVDVPVCIVQGKKDGIVPASTAALLFEELRSDEKKLIYSEHGKHHICYSDDREIWFEEVLKFLVKD